MTVELIPAAPLTDEGRTMPGRQIIEPVTDGWQQVALMEWELSAAEWTDRHPYDEINYVLEGELHVECEGRTVVAHAGDTVRVHAGGIGRYWAPEHARMLAIYGPNPAGDGSDSFAYRELTAHPEHTDPA